MAPSWQVEIFNRKGRNDGCWAFRWCSGATSKKPAVVALIWPSGPIIVQKSIVPASSMQFKIQSLDRFCCANSWSWKRTWPGWPRLCALTFLESVKMERCCWISEDLDPDGLICSSNAAQVDTGHARQGPVSSRLSRSLHVCPKMDSPILYIADSLQVPCWCTIGSMEGLAYDWWEGRRIQGLQQQHLSFWWRQICNSDPQPRPLVWRPYWQYWMRKLPEENLRRISTK